MPRVATVGPCVCGEDDVDEFYDGQKRRCKACVRRARLDRYAANRETEKAAMRTYARENAEAARERSRKALQAKPEHYRQMSKAWKAANREKVREGERVRYWTRHEQEIERSRAKTRNRDVVNARRRERRAARPDLERAEWRMRRGGRDRGAKDYGLIVERDPCAYCGRVGGVVDHIEPLRHGGPNAWENLTGACGFCNTSKRDRPLLIWMATRVLVP